MNERCCSREGSTNPTCSSWLPPLTTISVVSRKLLHGIGRSFTHATRTLWDNIFQRQVVDLSVDGPAGGGFHPHPPSAKTDGWKSPNSSSWLIMTHSGIQS